MAKAKAKAEDLTSSIIAGIRSVSPKKDGANGLVDISRSTDKILSRVSHVLKTGIAAFDELTGGIPFGKIVEIYGLESCGKTNLALRLAYQSQMKNILTITREDDGTKSETLIDPKTCDVAVLYIDNEQSLDDDEKQVVNGVTLDLAIASCDTVDIMFKIIENAVSKTEQREEKTGRPQFLVIVVDTIASTSSKEELSAEWGKDDYSRQAKQLRKGFRILNRRFSRANVCAVFTNQVSDKFGDSGAKGRPKSINPAELDFTSFGGKALRYYSTHRIFMFRLMSKYRIHEKHQFADGFLVGFYTTKNRLRKPCREGRMALLFDTKNGGLNDLFSKLETMIYLKAIEYDDGELKFKFGSLGIKTTTFSAKTTSLEDDDHAVSRRRDPAIKRSEWPLFYQEHQADCDLLWAKAVSMAFADRPDAELEINDDTDSIDVEEEEP